MTIFIIIYLGSSSVWPLLATRSWKPCHHIDDHPQEVDGKQDVELEVQVCEAGQIFLVTQTQENDYFSGTFGWTNLKLTCKASIEVNIDGN